MEEINGSALKLPDRIGNIKITTSKLIRWRKDSVNGVLEMDKLSQKSV